VVKEVAMSTIGTMGGLRKGDLSHGGTLTSKSDGDAKKPVNR
jgi:hypothetical protein